MSAVRSVDMGASSLAEALGSEMGRRGLTDTRAAPLLGVSQPTVTRWRTGQVVPAESQVKTLARFLGITQRDVRDLLGESSPPLPPETLPKVETIGVLLRVLERERGVTPADAWARYGIDKSRYYRLRLDKTVPHLVDVPELARALGVSEERVVLATYRTTIARGSRE